MSDDLPIPRLALNSVQLGNALSSKPKELIATDAQGNTQQLYIEPHPSSIEADCLIKASLGNYSVVFAVSQTALQYWLEPVIGHSPLLALPKPLLLAAINSRLHPYQTYIKAYFKSFLVIIDQVKAPYSQQYQVTLTLTEANHNLSALAYFNELSLVQCLPDKKKSINFIIDMDTSLYIGHTDLDIEEIQSVRLGDILFFKKNLWAHNKGIIKIEGVACYAVDINPENYHITQYVDPKNYQEFIMDETYNDLAEDINTDIPLGKIPIRISFELGTRRITLPELKDFQPGQVVTMDDADNRQILLKANGKTIGHGELVKVDKTIGVRILHLQSEQED